MSLCCAVTMQTLLTVINGSNLKCSSAVRGMYCKMVKCACVGELYTPLILILLWIAS